MERLFEKKLSRRKILLSLAPTFGAAALASCDKNESKSPSGLSDKNPEKTPTSIEGIEPGYQTFWHAYPEGTKIIDFEAKDPSGQDRKISEFLGKPIILVFNCKDSADEDTFSAQLITFLDYQLVKFKNQNLKTLLVIPYPAVCSLNTKPHTGSFDEYKSEYLKDVRKCSPKTEIWFADYNHLKEISPKDGDYKKFTFQRLSRLPKTYFLTPDQEILAEYPGLDYDDSYLYRAAEVFMKLQ